MTEVYEVATFYHHFDVVKEGETRAAIDHRARVRDACPARWRAATRCAASSRPCASAACACIGAPCIGRCEHAPAAVVGRNPIDERHRRQDRRRHRGKPRRARRRRRISTSQAYRAAGGYAPPQRACDGKRSAEAVIAEMEDSSAARPGRRGLSRRAASGRSCAPKPAPRLMAVNIDEGEPGTFKDRYYLERDPHRFLEGMLIAAWAVGIDDDLRLSARRIRRVPRDARARDRRARGRSAVRRCHGSTCAAAPARTSAAKSRR